MSLELSLIARIFGDETHYRNGPPTWKDAPTAGDAGEARNASIKRLRRFASEFDGAGDLADTLEKCASGHRCMSGACPECIRAFRRWFIPQIVDDLATLPDPDELHSISIIFPKHRTPADQLASLDTTNMRRSVSEAIKNLDGLEWMAGGIDLSLNDDTMKGLGVAWQPQLYAIAYANGATLSDKLRDKYRPTDLVRRPVQIKACDGSELAVSYSYKTDFIRRVAYLKTDPSNNRRPHWDTRKVSLSPRNHVQAMLWMHKVGFDGRLYLRGVRMTRVGNGVGLIQIRKRE